ncbi:hypothetical protein L7F22_005357 [Adiantum nelumboides]|nr:hypothetical protein [Adiantum nelumboides]
MQLLDCTKTFVEQGVNPPMLSCFLTETPSLALERSLLDEHRKVQDSLTASVPNCKLKGYNEDVSSSQATASSVIPHWMSSTKELEVRLSSSSNNGFTTDVAISKPQTLLEDLCPRFQKSLEPVSMLSVGNLGIQTGWPNDLSMFMQSRADESNSKHLFRQQLPAFSVGTKPLEAPCRKEQKEHCKVDLVSFLLQKQQKQAVEGFPKALSGQPLIHHGGKAPDKKAEVSSWVSKFPFQIGPGADFGQSVELRSSMYPRHLLEPNQDFLPTDNCPSQLAGSKNHNNHFQLSIQQSSSPMGVAKLGPPQNTQLPPVSSISKWPSTKPLGSDVPSLKRDWNTALMQNLSVKHPQLLPDFFAQQKVITAAKATIFSNGERLSEIKCKDFVSEKHAASRGSGEVSLINRNAFVSHECVGQQQQACEREAQEGFPHNSLSQVNMMKVKVEASSENFEASRRAESAPRECTRKKFQLGDFEGKFSPASSKAARQLSYEGSDVNKTISNSQATELMLFAECASTQLLESSTNVSASVPTHSFTKQFERLERGRTVPEGDWGEFLAGSKIMPAAETPAKIMLPFQQRFEQLQEFLRRCDGSDKFYCWRAFHMLSANERSDHVVELESRALRLSFEEGKEMKRAKLLNVLEEVPDGPFLTACQRPMGPWLSSKGTDTIQTDPHLLTVVLFLQAKDSMSSRDPRKSGLHVK